MQKGASFVFGVLLLMLTRETLAAQHLLPSVYLGRAPGAESGGCGESLRLDFDGEQIQFASYGELQAPADKRLLTRNGTVVLEFSPQILFRGRANANSSQIRGRLFFLDSPSHAISARPYILRAAGVPGRVTLSGMALSLTDSNGTATYRVDSHGFVSFGMTWNTRGDFLNNLYAFTNRQGRRVFLNGGNADQSLNVNLPLEPGTHTIQFAGAPGAETGFFTLTLYFDNDPAKRISGFADMSGAARLRPVPEGVETFDQYSGTQPSLGSLCLTNGALTVTLTDLRFRPSTVDIVGGACAHPDGGADTTGSFTLRVTTVR